ncbi:MAG: LarC family nickel insertion protein [Saprospiraceae bacterium]|nr:LarC family nickel insertion protein [Saprospiraceae bacterium]
MNTIYIEAFSGLSGDMLLSALTSLADYYDEIVKLPGRLHLQDGKVEIDTLNKNGIVCRHVRIVDLNTAASSSTSEGMAKDHHSHDQHHHDHHHHHHGASHDHGHHHGGGHRHLKDILKIIDQGHISANAKEIAKAIFMIIGQSESKIHNMDLEKIHFHEVSGVDSILDIVGCAVLIDHLKIDKTYCTPVCTGYGSVNTQHGLLPVPAPATADILMGIPTYPGDEKGERVTPTGAAILKYLQPEFTLPEIVTEKIAYGPGKKDFVGANVVRISIIKERKKKAQPLTL